MGSTASLIGLCMNRGVTTIKPGGKCRIGVKVPHTHNEVENICTSK